MQKPEFRYIPQMEMVASLLVKENGGLEHRYLHSNIVRIRCFVIISSTEFLKELRMGTN